MNITPHLGIGDLLLIKMKALSNHLTIQHINVNVNLLREYCGNYDVKFNFTIHLIKLLFHSTISATNGPCDFHFDKYPLTKTYIYNDLVIPFKPNEYGDYIVFHTKCRHDGLIDRFLNEILPDLILFLTNFKTTKTILLMGEKYIGDNVETRTHKTQSLYTSLLLLSDKNTVIDLTIPVLTDGNMDFNSFLNEIEIINKAKCNVTFGIGGPFNLCKAFSENNLSFIPFYNKAMYKPVLDQMIANSLVETVNELQDYLNVN